MNSRSGLMLACMLLISASLHAATLPRLHPGSPWYQRIDQAALHPDSTTMINTLNGIAPGGGFGKPEDLAAVAATGVSAIAVADALHWKRMTLAEIKRHAAAAGLDVRGAAAA